VHTIHHASNTQLKVLGLIVNAAPELVRILFARMMKPERNLGINADPEIVIHHIDLGVVLVRVRLAHIDGDRELPVINNYDI